MDEEILRLKSSLENEVNSGEWILKLFFFFFCLVCATIDPIEACIDIDIGKIISFFLS